MADEIKPETKPNSNKKKKLGAIILVVLVILGAVTLFFYLSYKATHISTDDAFIDGHIHTIASKVPGTVKQVNVISNQFVKKGDVLVELDPVDYEVNLKQAAAKLNEEKAKLVETTAKIESAKKQIIELDARASAIGGLLGMMKANFEQAEKDKKRMDVLYQKEVISKEKHEKTTTAYEVALAQVQAATEGLKYGLASVNTQQSALKEAEAARVAQMATVKQREALLKDAELKLSYTKVVAPIDGYVTQKSVEIGNQIQTGQPLMAVIPLALDDIYITANYKETQLEKVKPGQKVEFKVDTFSGKTFKGKVESIQSGTGSAFSLFPPENATGNYVKVVQRIPVRIVLDKDTDPNHVLRIGMSVVPTIIVE